jgi:hypothetical protein
MKRWASSNNLSNKDNLSHVLMDGGVLSIPCDKVDEFYGKCVDDIKNKRNIFVVEQKTDIYNFFVDIDYIDDEELGLDQVEAFVKVICDKVNKMGGKDCLVSICEPKPKNGRIKTGVHMNWPNFHVDQNGALTLRSHILSTLNLVYSSIKWDDVIDASVYGVLDKTKGSGFRMPWSHKSVKDRATGRQVVEGPYLPFMMYTGTEGVGPLTALGKIVHIDQDISVELLRMATIRSNETTPHEIPDAPDVSRKQEGGFTSSQTKNAVNDNGLVAQVQTFIRLNMEGQGTSRVKRMFKSKDAYLAETDSMYCENIQRTHNSNHVWFIMKNGQISQKCFCRCDTMKGRKSGFCKDFSGRVHTLSRTLTNELFPNKKKTRDNIKAAILPNAVINRNRTITSNCVSVYTSSF